MASSSDPGSWSARLIRSQKRDTGRKASLALTSGPPADSCCWSTGGATREANRSPGSSSTGRRLTVAVAAPVTMLVAPGPIDEGQAKGGGGRPGDHGARARPDRRGAGEGGQAVALLGVAGGDVDHALLVAGHVVGEPVGVLAQGLAHAGHVAVAEDPQAAGEQALFVAVALAVLAGQELDQGLGHGQPPRGHRLPPALVMGRRGPTPLPSQVPRTQAWAGSSQKRQARSGAGPAMTLR